MPKYLIQASYTQDGVAGVLAKGGSSRRDAIAQMASAAGGQLESLYFGFGDSDGPPVPDHDERSGRRDAAHRVRECRRFGRCLRKRRKLRIEERKQRLALGGNRDDDAECGDRAGGHVRPGPGARRGTSVVPRRLRPENISAARFLT